MKINASMVKSICVLCLLSISAVSVGGESQGYGGLMDQIGAIGVCGSNPGKTVHFKTRYSDKKLSGSSDFIFCAKSKSDCINNLNKELQKKYYKVENGIKKDLSSKEINSISSGFCKKKFP